MAPAHMTGVRPEASRYGRVPASVLRALAQVSTDAIIAAVEHDGTLLPLWSNSAMDSLLRAAPGYVLDGGLQLLGMRRVQQDGQTPGATAESPHDLVSTLFDVHGGATDVVIHRADDTTAVVHLTVTAVEEDDRTFWLLVMREVEDRIWADEELRASEERFRVVAAHAPIGVFASEVGMRLGYVNPRFAELWGRDV